MDSGAAVATIDDVALIGYCDYDTSAPSAPTGWAARVVDSPDRHFCADNLTALVSGSYSFQPTFPGTQNWLAQIAIFGSLSPSTPVDSGGFAVVGAPVGLTFIHIPAQQPGFEPRPAVTMRPATTMRPVHTL